ncbi:uncharacterized protein EV154DRAFT_530874 [Mucor mucedo]|uniref:uncharacterized protein n=1 Tax=Mucor mucedo TaxID=29922 RepID=UPI00221E437A|nr:uncharacterized protein EV154DRAFT_530874 [Mucor mucedo]KAI7869261.1 hypothetical protein EV154DRAFT_530874 [Mucor mucedo]
MVVKNYVLESLNYTSLNMTNWNELPLEVLIKIFTFVIDPFWGGNKKAIDYLLISKHWSLASRTTVYQNVNLNMKRFDAFIECMLKPNNGPFVKTINWKGTLDTDRLEANLDRLIAACPNVTSLGIGLWRDPNESIFAKLLLVHCMTKNGLKLKEIPSHSGETENAVRTYGYLAYALKKTLEHIKVYDWPKVEGEYVMNETANALVEFENLKSISFHFKDHDNICQVGSKIRNCPTIKHVTIYPSSLTCNMQAITTMPIDPYSVQPFPNIDGLYIYNAKIAIDSRLLGHVMYSYPKARYLIIAEQTPEPICEMTIPATAILYLQQRGLQVSVDLWIQFFNYLNILEACSVSTMFIKDYLDVFAHFPTFCDSLEIIFGRDQMLRIEPYISVYNNSDDIQFLKDRHIDYSTSRRTLFYLPPTVNGASVDFKAIVGLFESTLKALHIEMDPAIGNRLQKRMLCYALEHCPELNTLWITEGVFSSFDSNTFMKNESLECIRFLNCIFQNDFLFELSGRLSNKIEYLVFNGCTLGGESHESFVMIDMPYLSLGCLTWKDVSDYRNENVLFIKITKDQGICSYYKISHEYKMTISSAVQFNESKDNDEVFTMHIRCFDIESLLVQKLQADFIFYLTNPIKVGSADVFMDAHGEVFNML